LDKPGLKLAACSGTNLAVGILLSFNIHLHPTL
jgi:hypothetical protein